ncbi:hypothetical protein [Dyadobacter jiangsuensis]|uniref:Uncharacterized protein n=1 Tax=Dyadobacter jiangsuensis TaxID=1591085 RepID=A0A2P8FPG2_9BACT|nr:hypothetical protein [Dyadobacter jiangsuensis]PSL23620.1 hypothetical protein CLV60_116176 [Dyadobacter jiangsuensis]
MKTFLAYLTFAALLALCYIEKTNAEVAKSQAHAYRNGREARTDAASHAGHDAAVAQWGE